MGHPYRRSDGPSYPLRDLPTADYLWCSLDRALYTAFTDSQMSYAIATWVWQDAVEYQYDDVRLATERLLEILSGSS